MRRIPLFQSSMSMSTPQVFEQSLFLFYLVKIIHLFLPQIPTQNMWCAIYCEAFGESACPAFTMSPECQFVRVDASLAALGGATEAVYIMA